VPKEVPYLLVDAFTQEAGHGNRAGVVLDAAGLTREEMQQVAEILRVSETVFVTGRSGPEVRVRYFTPTQEIEFCGHATLAIGYVLASEGLKDGPAYLKTPVGTVPLDVERSGDGVSCVWMSQPEPSYRPLPPHSREVLAEAVGIDSRFVHRALPLGAASTGLWTGYLPLVDASILASLEPDLGALVALSRAWGISCVQAYAPTAPDSFACRVFAPAVGIPEDPVTGSAAGALAALLARHGVLPRQGGTSQARLTQGHALGSPGEVRLVVEYAGARPERVRVGGCAVASYEGSLRIG